MKKTILYIAALPFGICSPSLSRYGATISDCGAISLSSPKGTHILAIEAREVHDSTFGGTFSPTSFCNITVTLTHPGAEDNVRTAIWLPLSKWNGRFMATGGGGLAAGFDANMIQALLLGFATGSTDAGLTLGGTRDPNTATWALKADGSVNTELITNFAHRSLHEMTLLGKGAVASFYGNKPSYSYYMGCSQGGRQGYYAAQIWPEDYDGIMANSPAIHTPKVSPGDFWPSVVMGNLAVPPRCIFDAYQRAIIQTCDPQDGVVDGLVSNPDRCVFDAASLIGKEINCTDTGSTIAITAAFADVVARILEGARSATGEFRWFGVPLGADFKGLANTKTNDGSTVPVPFGPAEAWIRYFVAQDPTLDTAHLNLSAFDSLFQRSNKLYEPFLGTSNPDLTFFKKAGGKLLTWHGLADPLIAHGGTTLYWRSLTRNMGSRPDDFYRVFLAPGAGHCSAGYGPVPFEPLSALMEWVEKGKAPKTLFANTTWGGETKTRNLCHYPHVLRYKGKGDINDAESFACGCASN